MMFGSVHSRLEATFGSSAVGLRCHQHPESLRWTRSPSVGGLRAHEASPVLTVSRAGPGRKTGHVGAAAGYRDRIQTPDDAGVGEVWARGPNVMQGYFGNDAATRHGG